MRSRSDMDSLINEIIRVAVSDTLQAKTFNSMETLSDLLAFLLKTQFSVWRSKFSGWTDTLSKSSQK